MHELSITRSIVATVAERAVGMRVTRVRVEIGRLSAVMPDAVRFCFDVCAAGTVLEGAALEIVEVGGVGQCSDCGAQLPLAVPAGRCPACGGARLRIVAGSELIIKEMEVEACA